MELANLLNSNKEKPSEFLKQLVPLVFTATDESLVSKAVTYLVSWLLMPSLDKLPPLPSNLVSLHQKLKTSTSDVLPLYFHHFLEAYPKSLEPSIKAILYSDTVLALVLMIDNYSEEALSSLEARDCIPPLLWILTYSQTKKAIHMLPKAITKPKGVKEIIEAFGRGDDKQQLKVMCTKVLSSPPKFYSQKYFLNIAQQILEMLLHSQCDLYTKDILSRTLSNIMQKETQVASLVTSQLEFNSQKTLDKTLECLEVLSAKEPPAQRILEIIYCNFTLLVTLQVFLENYKAVYIKEPLKKVLIQFFRYHNTAASSLVKFIQDPVFPYSFQVNEKGKVLYTNHPQNLDPLDAVVGICNFLSQLQDSSLSKKCAEQVFSELLSEFKDNKPEVTAAILHMAQNIEVPQLVSNPTHLKNFLKTMLNREDTQTIAGTLSILTYLLSGDYSIENKQFLVEIWPKVLDLSKHHNIQVRELSGLVDSLISKQLSGKDLSCYSDYKHLSRELSSKEPYRIAAGLQKLNLLIKFGENFEVYWDLLDRILEECDVFVLNSLSKTFGFIFEVKGAAALQHLRNAFFSSSELSKSKVIEILYQNIGVVSANSEKLLHLIRAALTQNNPDVRKGTMLLLSEFVKHKKLGVYPYLPEVVSVALGVVQKSSSSLYQSKAEDETLPSALLILKRLLKYSCRDHISSYTQEILEKLSILQNYYYSPLLWELIHQLSNNL